MRIGWLAVVGAVAIWAAPAAAGAADEPRPRIAVSGNGSVMTPPDLATIDYRIVGEGATSDAAVTAMVAKRQRIDAGLAALDRRLEPRASEVSVAEVRGPECRQYGAQRLSTGACAILGYTATLQISLRTAAVKQAGTVVGLIGRLEGTTLACPASCLPIRARRSGGRSRRRCSTPAPRRRRSRRERARRWAGWSPPPLAAAITTRWRRTSS